MKAYKFRFWFEVAGGHTHVTLRAGSVGAESLAKAGDFVLRNEEFQEFRERFGTAPYVEFIEKPNLRIGGDDPSLWLRK